ncbi:MAG: hypothetical protein ACTSO8_07335 [Promethearchaeota archaeon]
MPRNNSIVGSIVGLIIFLGFGMFFLFGLSPFSLFNFMPFFPMIFIIIIIGIAGAASASSRRSTSCSSKSHSQYQYYTPEVSISNPYNVKTSSSSTVRSIYIEGAEPEKPMANFCQYCGTKKDKNAIYCYDCGTKL